MMKRIWGIAVAAITLGSIWAHADYKAGYYDKMDGLKREALKEAAKQCVSQHKQLGYYDLPDYWQYSDVYPDLTDGCKRWWEMYSDAVYLIYPGQSGTKSFSANKMQREHSIPKSWWKKNGDVEYTPAYSDMWNLYPSDGAANQAKLNYPFGEVRSASYDNGVTKVGPAKSGYGGGSTNVFEPADEYKGDFARTIFYMATVYDDLTWVYDYMFVTGKYPTLVPWAYNMLLQWSRQDPVSQKEIDRNNIVEQYQGNRNPFIDFPNLAEYIWGVRTQEAFLLSEQENSDPTPPITGTPEITLPENGESLDFGQAAVGHSVTRALQISGHNLTSPLSLRVVGSDKAMFEPEVTSIPASTMNQNGGYLLQIRYLPTSVGTHEARLTLYDGGIDGSIAVTLRGEALEVPELKALHALEATDVTDNGYTCRWEAPSGEIADYYVLTRVKYVDGGEEAESYETGETFYRVEDRDSSVAESYSVTYVRLGIESPQSNAIYVAATGGVEGVNREAPVHVYGERGGILVQAAPGEGGHLRVWDMSGTLLIDEISPADGRFFRLAPGLYVATIDKGRPKRLIVK